MTSPSFVLRSSLVGRPSERFRKSLSRVFRTLTLKRPLRFHRPFSSLLLVREDRKVLQQSQLFQYSNFLSLSSVYDNAAFTISDSRFKAAVAAFFQLFAKRLLINQ